MKREIHWFCICTSSRRDRRRRKREGMEKKTEEQGSATVHLKPPIQVAFYYHVTNLSRGEETEDGIR